MKCAVSCCLLILAITRLWSAPANALAFTQDSAMLALGVHQQIEFRSVPDGNVVRRIPSEFSRFSSLAFDGSNSVLVTAGGTPGESGAAIVLAWKEAATRQRFTNFSDLVTSARFNPDATRLAVSSADGSAMLCSLATGGTNSVVALRGHSGPVLDIAWSPRSDFVVTASADRSLKVWSSDHGKLLRSFSHHTEPVHAVVFRPRLDASDNADKSPAQCASASDDTTVRIWQPQIGRMVRIVRHHEGPVFALAYTPDGAALFSAGKEGVIRRIDTESDQILGKWKAHQEPIYRIVISPDGKFLASGDWAGIVHLWRISNGELQKL